MLCHAGGFLWHATKPRTIEPIVIGFVTLELSTARTPFCGPSLPFESTLNVESGYVLPRTETSEDHQAYEFRTEPTSREPCSTRAT